MSKHHIWLSLGLLGFTFFGLVWSRVVYLQTRFEHDGSPLEQRCTSSSYLLAATSSEIVIQQNAIICIAPVEGGSPSSSTFCKWASNPSQLSVKKKKNSFLGHKITCGCSVSDKNRTE